MSQTETDDAAIEQWWSLYEDCTDQCDEIRVEVYLRSLAPEPGVHARRVHFLQELDDVADRDIVDTYAVRVVGNSLCVCDECREFFEGHPIFETVEALMSWRGGGIRACGFSRCESSASLTDEYHQTVKPPNLTLGIYGDDSLIGVFPCRAEGTQYSPAAFLDRLMTTVADDAPVETRLKQTGQN